jgi:putative CocE/NonD family hydrolase
MEAGAFDQRETSALYGARRVGPLAERDDVVVFRTSVLDKDLIVAGPVSAELWVSSSAVDGDIMLKLIDEYPPSDDYPDGYAMNLSHGVLRLRFRNGFDRIELMEPGAVYRVRVQLFPTANRFVAGHRLRLDIAGSNFPHFDVNPHTGAPSGEVTGAVVATHHVHWGAAQPSRLELCRVSAM